MDIFRVFDRVIKNSSETLTGATMILSLLAAGYFLKDRDIKKINTEIVEMVPSADLDKVAPGEVKIGELTITFGKDEAGNIGLKKIESSGNDLLDQLSYIEKYFSEGKNELEILKIGKPSAKIVCTFSDSIMRVENNKEKAKKIWEYLNTHDSELGDHFKLILNELLSQASLIKEVTKESILQTLGEPVKPGTLCGFMFNTAYSFIGSNTVSKFQALSKELIIEITKHFSTKVNNGADQNTLEVANIFTNLVLDLSPEQNR